MLAKTEEGRNKVKLFLNDAEVTDPYWDNTLFMPVCLQKKRCKEIIQEFS